MSGLAAGLEAHHPADAIEAADLARILALVDDDAVDPWSRRSPLHLTGSAIVLHPESRRVLLRYHRHLGRFLHVGGHGDPGEHDPFAVALREAREETGLADLAPWPAGPPTLVQVAVLPVPAKADEPAHEHADLRYFLATQRPELAVAETPASPVEWRDLQQAREELRDDRLGPCLERALELLSGGGSARSPQRPES